MVYYKKKDNQSKIRYFFPFIFLLILWFFYKNFSTSVFIKNKDRINLVFYSQNTSFFSLGKNDIDYLINFYPSTKILVPGGYRYYRVGALGKLIDLEKNPEIFKKVFSSATSSFVDLYFYPPKTEIYYDKKDDLFFPSLKEIFFFKSNGNFLDRIILFFKFISKHRADFKIIDVKADIFDDNKFHDDYIGIFYKKKYREIMPTVQIIYTKSYSTAYLLSRIITGEGIRVVDLKMDDHEKINNCQIISKNINFVVWSLADFFGCEKKVGETEVSDIIIKLGKLESDWSFK
jgi:hypothetical protein